ncbi:MAG: hypothetical protein R2755_22070 [Acidimicrobiales bacterium]
MLAEHPGRVQGCTCPTPPRCRPGVGPTADRQRGRHPTYFAGLDNEEVEGNECSPTKGAPDPRRAAWTRPCSAVPMR